MTLQAPMPAVKGKGTYLQMGAALESIAKVARVMKVTPPKGSVNTDESTPLETAVAEEKAPGLPNWSGSKFQVGYAPTETVLMAAFKAAALKYWQIVFSNGTKWDFWGTLTSFEVGEIDPKTGLLTATCEIEPSGDVEVTQPA